MLEVKYLDNPAKWPILADKLREAKEFGYDTETYNQPEGTSPQWRAKIHCWSVGLLTNQVSNRGYRKAVGLVLPVSALEDPSIRSVFADRSITKWAHNAPHDYHATVNMGLVVNGMVDSLQWFRVAFPGLLGYGLKQIAIRHLGYSARPTFVDMVTYVGDKITVKRSRQKGCICGDSPCHQRSNKEFLSSDGVYRYHTRVSWSRFTPVHKNVEMRYSVTDFVPGRELKPLTWNGETLDRWKEWLNYSAEDAIQGIESVDYLRNYKFRKIEYPWV